MFVYYISVDVRKISELVQPSAGVRDVPNIIGDYIIGVTRAKDV